MLVPILVLEGLVRGQHRYERAIASAVHVVELIICWQCRFTGKESHVATNIFSGLSLSRLVCLERCLDGSRSGWDCCRGTLEVIVEIVFFVFLWEVNELVELRIRQSGRAIERRQSFIATFKISAVDVLRSFSTSAGCSVRKTLNSMSSLVSDGTVPYGKQSRHP